MISTRILLLQLLRTVLCILRPSRRCNAATAITAPPPTPPPPHISAVLPLATVFLPTSFLASDQRTLPIVSVGDPKSFIPDSGSHPFYWGGQQGSRESPRTGLWIASPSPYTQESPPTSRHLATTSSVECRYENHTIHTCLGDTNQQQWSTRS